MLTRRNGPFLAEPPIAAALTLPATSRHRFVRRVVLAAAVLVPLGIMAVQAAFRWDQVWKEAENELSRTADAAAEYSLRVLDGHRLALDRVNDLLQGLSDDNIRARELELHNALRRMLPDLPLVQTVAVNDRNGGVLLTANIFPVPRDIDVNDREWMRDLRASDAPRTHVSKVYVGRLDQFLFFAVARRRTNSGNGLAPGAFDGVINISVPPNQLALGFADLVGAPTDVIALVRSDGEILARRPGFTAPLPPLSDAAPFQAAVESKQERGHYFGQSIMRDDTERLVAFRKLRDYPVYAVTARETAAIAKHWAQSLAGLMSIGLPAVFILGLLALIARRREHDALSAQAALTQEIARRAAAEAARAGEARFRAIFESDVVGMVLMDRGSGDVAAVNDCLLRMTGHKRVDVETGPWLREITPPELHERDRKAFADAQKRGRFAPYEKEILRADGSRLPVRLSAAPLPGEDGQIVILVQDISEQREAEARRDLMMREIEHRGKNTLAVIQATLQLGASDATDVKSLAVAVEGRIQALARAQSLLSEGQWLGSNLRALVASAFAPFFEDGDRSRISIDGPPVMLAPSVAQTLSMVLHELQPTQSNMDRCRSAPDLSQLPGPSATARNGCI
jgi:PAS domain S-box-containing protein